MQQSEVTVRSYFNGFSIAITERMGMGISCEFNNKAEDLLVL